MSSRRTLILLGAIAVGIIAAFVLFNYVSGIEERERGEAELVDVKKAEATIEKGITGQEAFDAGALVDAKIPREFRPADYVQNLDEIAGQVALFDIPAGTPITKQMFVDRSQAITSFRNRLRDDGSRVAISFSVDQVRGVADLLVPGDYVNMFVKLEEPSEEEANGICNRPIEQGGCVLLPAARMLLQDVHILAIGQTPVLVAGESSPDSGAEEGEEAQAQETQAGLITVDVPVESAQWIASVVPDSIYLTLNPENYAPEALPPLNPVADVLPGEDGAQVTPYGTDPDTYKED